MMAETSWFQRFSRATFDMLVPLINTVAPDRRRAKSMLLTVAILVARHLMSSLIYASSYEVRDGVIRTPELFPVYDKSLTEWSTFMSTNPFINTIFSLPKPKPVTDAS